jgi:hypothetical protein
MPFWPLAAGYGHWFKKHLSEELSIAVLQLKVKLVYE